MLSLLKEKGEMSTLWPILLSPPLYQSSLHLSYKGVYQDPFEISYPASRLIFLLSINNHSIEPERYCYWILYLSSYSTVLLSHSDSLSNQVITTLSQLYGQSVSSLSRITIFYQLLLFYLVSDSLLQSVITTVIASISQIIPLNYSSPFTYPPVFSSSQTVCSYLQFLLDTSLLLLHVQISLGFSPSSFISFTSLIGSLLKETSQTTQTEILHYLLMKVKNQDSHSQCYLMILSQLPWILLKYFIFFLII